MKLNKPGRFDTDIKMCTGHSGAVLDFDFNPFHDDLLASCSEDQTVKIWRIPDGGLTENLNTPEVDMHGHGKKVTLLRFHPTAESVLASTSADQTVKLWDISVGQEISTLADAHEQLIQDIVWDYTGTCYATSSKDKNVRICDARTATVSTMITTAHEGSKSTKMSYLGSFDKLVTIGFTRQSQRQFKIWDPRNTSEALKQVDVDQAAGVIMPFFDCDTQLLYLAGKGDGNIRYYEVVNETPYCFSVAEHRSSVSAKGMAWVPKRGLNIMACETARLLKLTSNSVEPLSFFVPRKSEAFQEDIFPDTFSGEPSHTAQEWLAGSDLPPRLMSLNPASGKAAKGPPKPVTPIRTVAIVDAELKVARKENEELKEELQKAKARILELEQKLEAATAASSPAAVPAVVSAPVEAVSENITAPETELLEDGAK
eukprot:CAMPEP_0182418156 /NCGR_PEP_ID=MMETSP1167-20130531/2620_1 /TAXON_ID=2988 /ORGANISM="Mallomonas Sp, Strain CCMP3275" /LENGTH=427 /DNA_ID=CAMNT_0024592195 /DNA_START=286 /DNA_END=1569 /DNA_ORIENTATION=+